MSRPLSYRRQVSRKKKRWLIGIGSAVAFVIIALLIAAAILARRMEPYVRQQAIEYLQKRFNSDVSIAALHLHLPNTSPLRLMMTGGRGALGRVDGSGIILRPRGQQGPPLFAMKKFSFSVDIATLFA